MFCKNSIHIPDLEYGHFKILIPAIAAGAIIGPKGSNITALQEETTTTIELSKLFDYYPGTSERVCLISGHKKAILRALEFIITAISSKPSPDTSACIDHDRKITFERGKQVKILLPNKMVSKIIGNCGKTIKDIKLKSGAYVQISQICTSLIVYERCITVMGELENNIYACQMIIDKVVGDKTMDRFLHVSYTHIRHYVPNANPTGYPVANNSMVSKHNESDNKAQSLDVSSTTSSSASNVQSLHTSGSDATSRFHDSFPLQNPPSTTCDQHNSFPSENFSLYSHILSNVPSSFHTQNTLPNSATSVYEPSADDMSQVIETLKLMIRSKPFTDEVFAKINHAMCTLENYGVLDLCLRIYMRSHLNYSSHSKRKLHEKPYFNPTSDSCKPRRVHCHPMFTSDSDLHAINTNFSDPLQSALETSCVNSQLGDYPNFFRHPMHPSCVFDTISGASAAMNPFSC